MVYAIAKSVNVLKQGSHARLPGLYPPKGGIRFSVWPLTNCPAKVYCHPKGGFYRGRTTQHAAYQKLPPDTSRRPERSDRRGCLRRIPFLGGEHEKNSKQSAVRKKNC
jgi:hypothetical protein